MEGQGVSNDQKNTSSQEQQEPCGASPTQTLGSQQLGDSPSGLTASPGGVNSSVMSMMTNTTTTTTAGGSMMVVDDDLGGSPQPPQFNPSIFGPPAAVVPPPDQPLLADEQEHYDARLDERYERLEGMIGEGTYGRVYKAKDRWTGRIVAMKKLSPRNSNLRLLMRELSILRHVQHHPSVVSLLNVLSKRNGRIDLVTEYLPTNLMSWYQTYPKGYFPGSVVRSVMLQLIQGLQFLKDRCVIHRDVKPSNILVELSEEFLKREEEYIRKIKQIKGITPTVKTGVVGQKQAVSGGSDDESHLSKDGIEEVTGSSGDVGSSTNEFEGKTAEEKETLCEALLENFHCDPCDIKIKLCDFGSARMMTPEDPFEYPQMNTPTNTCSPCWRSPEQFLASRRYDHAVDMWAAGCIMAELFLGDVLIYCEDCDFGFLRVILQLRGTPATPQAWNDLLLNIETFPAYYETAQQAYHSTILGLMELPKFQPTPLGSLKEGLLGRRAGPSGALDLMDKMLSLFPQERISPSDALQHPFFHCKHPSTAEEIER